MLIARTRFPLGAQVFSPSLNSFDQAQIINETKAVLIHSAAERKGHGN